MATPSAAGRCLPPGAEGDRFRISVTAIEKAGYGAVWRGQKSWNGVAILARDCEPVLTRTALPGDPADTQSRYIEAAVNGVLIATLYAPNGNPQPGPKFKYKLAWMKRLLAHAAELYAARCAGRARRGISMSCRPTPTSIPPSPTPRTRWCSREPRALFRRLLDQGWIDAIRTMHPDYADVHVLGLQAKPLATRRRPSHRSSAAEPQSRKAPG